MVVGSQDYADGRPVLCLHVMKGLLWINRGQEGAWLLGYTLCMTEGGGAL